MQHQDQQAIQAERAGVVYAAMQQAMYLGPRTSLYRETAWLGDAIAFVWPFSRALQATLTLAGIPRSRRGGVDDVAAVEDRLVGLARYWNPNAHPPAYDSAVRPPFGQGGDRYHDDNAWIALALVQRVRMALSTSLERPAELFAFARAGWSTHTTEPLPGGVFWLEQDVGFGRTNHDRGAGATAGSAELGLHLHELTGSSAYDGDGQVAARPGSLGALNMLGWVSAHLDQSGDGGGPYLNLVRRDGSIDTNLWSYNQGVMIGAYVLRYRLDGRAEHLRRAETIAQRTLRTFGDFRHHPPAFNAMCFQNLLMLHAATSDAGLRSTMLEAMQRYADWAWDPASGARDPSSNLFAFDDGGRPARGKLSPRLQDQGAMVQVYGLLAWDAADYPRLT